MKKPKKKREKPKYDRKSRRKDKWINLQLQNKRKVHIQN